MALEPLAVLLLSLDYRVIFIGPAISGWHIGLTISRFFSSLWFSRDLVLFGISYYFLFTNAGTENFFLILGGYALSWIAGYVVVFAPGGIGVRESVQVFLFSSIASPQQIVIVSLMHRMVYTIIEVILGLAGYLLTKRNPQNPGHITG